MKIKREIVHPGVTHVNDDRSGPPNRHPGFNKIFAKHRFRVAMVTDQNAGRANSSR